ncbi:MAG TPA: hypothetical protein VF507_10865, partial [Pyrinomonadaceae bacterium]
MNRSRSQRRFVLFLFSTALVVLSLYLLDAFQGALLAYVARMMPAHPPHESVLNIPKLVLWSALAYLFVRATSAVIFDLIFRLRRGYAAPALVRNIFSIVAFTVLFILIFNRIYENVNLGALF